MLKKPDNKKKFIDYGIKYTKQRNLIFNVLNSINNPLSAEEFFLKLNKKNSSINLSTVYRILELFVSKGIVIKTYIGSNNKAMFELNSTEHKHYLVCLKCKKNIIFDNCPLKTFEKKLMNKTDFDITGHRIEIYGYCSNCK